eukprot:COSAG01_NODE_10821_length_2073_cov_10.895948_2_plen_130_part_01
MHGGASHVRRIVGDPMCQPTDRATDALSAWGGGGGATGWHGGGALRPHRRARDHRARAIAIVIVGTSSGGGGGGSAEQETEVRPAVTSRGAEAPISQRLVREHGWHAHDAREAEALQQLWAGLDADSSGS